MLGENMENEIEINGEKYVLAKRIRDLAKEANKLDGRKYVIVRTYSAGVFAGYLEKREGKEAIMINARRLWYWDGASSLSQLAMEGTKKPDNCKFPCEVSRVELTEVVEVLDVTEQAQKSINSVRIWQQ